MGMAEPGTVRPGAARAVAVLAGALAAVTTGGLVAVALVRGPGLNAWNLATLVAGGVAAALAIARPDRAVVLVVSAGLLAIAFISALASVGWLYLPSLVLAVIGIALLRRGARTSRPRPSQTR